jgi:hypothetical protein
MATHVFFSGDTPDGETSSTYTIPAGETATVSVDAEGHSVHSVLQVKQPTSHYFSDFRRAQAQKRNHGDALAVRG